MLCRFTFYYWIYLNGQIRCSGTVNGNLLDSLGRIQMLKRFDGGRRTTTFHRYSEQKCNQQIIREKLKVITKSVKSMKITSDW